MVVDKTRISEEYPIGTKKDVGWQTVRNNDIHLGDIEAIHSGDLDVNRRALKAGFIEDTREIQVVYNGS